MSQPSTITYEKNDASNLAISGDWKQTIRSTVEEKNNMSTRINIPLSDTSAVIDIIKICNCDSKCVEVALKHEKEIREMSLSFLKDESRQIYEEKHTKENKKFLFWVMVLFATGIITGSVLAYYLRKQNNKNENAKEVEEEQEN